MGLSKVYDVAMLPGCTMSFHWDGSPKGLDDFMRWGDHMCIAQRVPQLRIEVFSYALQRLAAAGTEAEEKASPLSRLFGGGGTQKLKVGPPTPTAAPGGGTRRLRRGQRSAPAQKDANTVFLAGATGRLGARILRALLEADPAVKVRAAARSAPRGQAFLDTAASIGALPADAARRVSVVEVDLTQPEDIRAALGGASKVVQAIGAPESEPFNFQLPKKIDGDAAIALVEAATSAGVDQYVMVTSLGTGKWGWPAGILNLFGGVLIQKRRAEVALEESGLPYVVVRPGGMERPKDDYKDTHNVRLALRDTEFGGQVSRWQVAELIAAAVANPSLAENKVLEVVAETEAPLLSYEELLSGAVCEEPQAERTQRAKETAAAKAEVSVASERVEAAKAALAEADNVARQLADAAARARGEIDATRASLKDTAPQVFESQSLQSQLEQRRAALAEAAQGERAAKAVLVAATAAARQGRLLSDAERADAERSVRQPEQWAADQEAKRAAQAQADAKAKQDAAEMQRRSNEEKVRAAMERAKAEAESRRTADEQRARAAKQARAQAEADVRKALEVQERAREEAKAKAEADAKRRSQEVKEAIKAQKKAEEVRMAAAATAKAEKQAKEQAAASAVQKAKPAKELDVVQVEKKADQVRMSTAATAKAVKKVKEETAASAVRKAKPDGAPKGKNAEEVRAWIESWRNGDSSAGAQQGSNGAAPGAAEGGLKLVADVGDGPLTWLQKLRLPWAQTGAQEEVAPASAQGNGAAPAPAEAPFAGQAPAKRNMHEAREWIRQWRARTLEKALPKGVTAKQ
ncbi:hypothetical protein WJX81_002489 [Elliptochloris bilobata]|uniref:NAD(P)-binding domain-containing protein n=1 Tax=Elliptochloris bilobata TaxID=381761 RepID=A0AAW1SCK3_9CHLO